MSIVLEDPIHMKAPPRSPVRPTAPIDPGTTSGKREVSFELESRGGYRRIVTGTIAYLDEEAHAYMVLAANGELIRVPLWDIRSSSSVTNRRSIVHALSKPSKLRNGATVSPP